jgi:hypothetical protein
VARVARPSVRVRTADSTNLRREALWLTVSIRVCDMV